VGVEEAATGHRSGGSRSRGQGSEDPGVGGGTDGTDSSGWRGHQWRTSRAQAEGVGGHLWRMSSGTTVGGS
jgi:hypothetical protein